MAGPVACRRSLPAGAAHADQRRRAGSEAFRANWIAANVTYSIPAGFDFSQRRVYRREMLAALIDERGNMLPLERYRCPLRVVLVIAAGRSFPGTGDDGVELPLQLGNTDESFTAIGIQPRSGDLRVCFRHRLRL